MPIGEADADVDDADYKRGLSGEDQDEHQQAKQRFHREAILGPKRKGRMR